MPDDDKKGLGTTVNLSYVANGFKEMGLIRDEDELAEAIKEKGFTVGVELRGAIPVAFIDNEDARQLRIYLEERVKRRGTRYDSGNANDSRVHKPNDSRVEQSWFDDLLT